MNDELFKIPQKPENKKRHYIFIPCKTDECGMKLEWENDCDAPIDGAWNWWMDKDGNVEYARMKEDVYDHFFPSPEHLNLQNSTWEIQSLAGYFKEVDEKSGGQKKMKSCNDCEFYHDEYGGVCFAQKDAPRVESLTIAKTCSDFTYKDAKILLDPISLSKEQVRDIYEFLEGKDNPTGEDLYKNICENISRVITEKLTAEAERLIFS